MESSLLHYGKTASKTLVLQPGTIATGGIPWPHQEVTSSVDVSVDRTDEERSKEVTWDLTSDQEDSDPDGDVEAGQRSSNETHVQKQSQLSDTLTWLSDNYERAEGVCLPRCVLYTHYLDYCKKKQFTPAGAATFGKIIRQRFPKLTTRRLGTRGQSKYHYYGIGIKETSIYYHSVYSGKGLTRFSGVKIKTEGSSRKYSLSSKSGTLLPEFPESSNLILPEGVSREKVYTFIMMYRTHCQRILDTVIGANFEEVQTFYLHFWQGMPDHLVEVLEASIITDIVGLCDSILYKVLIDVLVPSTIQDLPDSLNTEIKLFVKHLPYWLENSLEDVPKKLREKKLEVVKNFAHNMKRQMAFVHLAQTTRSVLLNHENVAQMVNDLAALDFNSICSQAAFTDDTFVQKEIGTICDFFNEFQDLLTKQAPIEAFTEWMDNLIDKCVIQPSKENNDAFRKKAGEFLRHWAVFGSLIMRDLTLQNAASFGSFHLLHMMFDEYVFLVIETQQATVDEHLLQKSVQKLMKNAGEISMQAKVRCVGKDKGKKRKMEDEPFIVQDASGAISGARTKHFLMPYPHLHGDVGTATAFTRPNTNTAFRETTPCYYGNDRLGSTHSQRATALKHYTSLSDRPYFPHHVTFGSFPDYSAQANTFATSFPQTFSDNHSYQPINSVHMQQYWNEAHARSHHHHAAFSDPYSYTGYGRFNSGYDAFAKTSPYLRSHATTFQDYNRNTFEDSRHFYGRPHDHGLAGTHFPVNHSYGASFMEIAPANNQDDVYALPAAPQLGMGGFHHTKSFIPTYR